VEELVQHLAERVSKLEHDLAELRRTMPKSHKVTYTVDHLPPPTISFPQFCETIYITLKHFQWLLEVDTKFSKSMTDEQYMLSCMELILQDAYTTTTTGTNAATTVGTNAATTDTTTVTTTKPPIQLKPLIAFTEKHHVLYVYEYDETQVAQWRPATTADIKELLTSIQHQMLKLLRDYRQANLDKCAKDDRLCIKLDKMRKRLLTVDPNDAAYVTRCMKLIYSIIHIPFPQPLIAEITLI
jgi:hypothetical protein